MSNIITFPFNQAPDASGFAGEDASSVQKMTDVRVEIEHVFRRLTTILDELTNPDHFAPQRREAAISPSPHRTVSPRLKSMGG
ncbi:hypothetical protein [Rhizobium chutanense]|nr:hypothetical protein [Rhizobium chutanense]